MTDVQTIEVAPAKPWWMSKVLLLTLVQTVLGTLEVTLPVVRDFLPPTWFALVTIVIAIVVAVLRVIDQAKPVVGGAAIKSVMLATIGKTQ